MARLRRVGTVAVFLVVAALVSACGPGAEKQRAADAIAASGQRQEIRVGEISLASSAVETTRPLAPRAGDAVAPARAELVVDGVRGRAALLAPSAAAAKIGVTTSTGGPPALILFAGPVTYVRRPTQGIAGARPWYRFDTRTLRDLSLPSLERIAEPRALSDLVVVSPLVLLEQTAGVLTGSLESLGAEEVAVAGSAAIADHYRANASIDKVTREFRRDADETRFTQRLLRAFAISGEINTLDAWLYRDGRLGRLALTYASRPEKGVRFDMRFDMRLAPVSSQPAVAREVLDLPDSEDVVQVTTLSQLRGVVAQWFGTGTGQGAG